MTIACALLQQHIQTLVDDNAQWQKLIADDIVWELTYASSLGHPARLSGREEVVRHASWFVGAVENFRFSDLAVHAFAGLDSYWRKLVAMKTVFIATIRKAKVCFAL